MQNTTKIIHIDTCSPEIYASPGGAGRSCGISTTHSPAQLSTDYCPHTYGVRVCSCAAFATEPCRPTACVKYATNLPSPSTDHCSLLGYRYVSPNGDGWAVVATAAHFLTQSPSDHSSLITVHSSYTFSAKEKDSETGLSYFGARYYSSDLSVWISVDPMSDKYPSLSPYVYCANNPVKLVDPNGMEYGNPIEDALKVISNFEHSTTTSVFRNIPKSKFIEDLTQHIKDPASIHQGGNGTCGAAVLSKYMAENHPVLYAEAAISLYTTGKFSHNGVSLSLPNSAFSGSMTELNELGINSVDAIMQGAFTNSQNIIFNYNPFKDGSGFKSFMYPGYFNYYVSGFLGANYHCVLSPTTEYINSLDFVNHFVVGIVHSNDYSIEGGFPNHYIQILKSGNNKMDYWTWGEKVNGSTINNSLRNGFYMIISIGL